MVDFPGALSLLHASLDAWPMKLPEHEEFLIRDEVRLARRLNVDFFVRPPDFRTPDRDRGRQELNNLRLPFVRFPLWHVCPRCGRMQQGRFHDTASPYCEGPSGGTEGARHPRRSMIQVRFVAACPKGHLQDFPWVEWLFEGHAEQFLPESMWLRLRGRGSASLAGVEVTCEGFAGNGRVEVVKRRTLAGAFSGDAAKGQPSAFSALGIQCSGFNPVLAIPRAGNPAPGCGEHLYPLLRGAANLYFAHVVSAIFVPPLAGGYTQDILDILESGQVSHSLVAAALDSEEGLLGPAAARRVIGRMAPELREKIDPSQLADAVNRVLLPRVVLSLSSARAYIDQQLKLENKDSVDEHLMKEILDQLFKDWSVDPRKLAELVNAARARDQSPGDGQSGTQDDESAFRRHEYEALRRDMDEGRPRRNLLVLSRSLGEYGSIVTSNFSRISLVHKLRETRAFAGFSRLFPEDTLSPAERRRLIAAEPPSWLPATEVRGEGIFLELREDAIRAWLTRTPQLAQHLARMNANLSSLRLRRHQPPRTISPRFVLLHTLAHALITQLVYECGYGSASLRERIYSDDSDEPMAGTLIYTAAGDSEGTMGGLVSMGEPGRIEGVIARAVARTRWCSADPVCIESKGQGPDSCNLAACHACALLPETSCEEQNRMLDRAMLIGTLEDTRLGFFAGV